MIFFLFLKKINSFLGVLKEKKSEENISYFDISDRQKCFIIRVKNKFDSYFAQENGGSFFSYLKKFKDIRRIELYPDTLNFDKEKLTSFFSEFVFLHIL